MLDMVISVCLLGPRPSRPRWRPCARGRSARSLQGPKHSGGRRQASFFDVREECRAFAAGEKSWPGAVAGRRSRRLPSLGPDQPFEIRVGRVMTVLTERTLATAT